MLVKGVVDEDFLQYKKPSMVILFPSCSFKCEKECGEQVCQNSALAQAHSFDIKVSDIVKRYTNNVITSSICFGGLEPFDNEKDLFQLLSAFRRETMDDIVIYTGYTEEEIYNKGLMPRLKMYYNIIIKFGRYIPHQEKHYDEVLGIYLASPNQYGRVITNGNTND